MSVYCVYLAMSKCATTKKKAKFYEKSRNKSHSNCFQGCPYTVTISYHSLYYINQVPGDCYLYENLFKYILLLLYNKCNDYRIKSSI